MPGAPGLNDWCADAAPGASASTDKTARTTRLRDMGPPPVGPGDPTGGAPTPGRTRLAGETAAGLEQRLEVAEHPRPAAAGAGVLALAADQRVQVRSLLEFVDDRELGALVALLLDLVGEAGEALLLHAGIHRHPPRLHEAARRGPPPRPPPRGHSRGPPPPGNPPPPGPGPPPPPPPPRPTPAAPPASRNSSDAWTRNPSPGSSPSNST